MSRQSLLQRLDAKPAVDGVRQPPSQNRPAGPIDDRHEIQNAMRHREVMLEAHTWFGSVIARPRSR
jgi:hypothetical protein